MLGVLAWGCAGMMEVGASVRDMGEVRAGRDAVTVTVIPVETGIQARGGVVDGVGGCGILTASRYSFPFSR